MPKTSKSSARPTLPTQYGACAIKCIEAAAKAKTLADDVREIYEIGGVDTPISDSEVNQIVDDLQNHIRDLLIAAADAIVRADHNRQHDRPMTSRRR